MHLDASTGHHCPLRDRSFAGRGLFSSSLNLSPGAHIALLGQVLAPSRVTDRLSFCLSVCLMRIYFPYAGTRAGREKAGGLRVQAERPGAFTRSSRSCTLAL